MAGKGGAWKVAYADFVTAMMALFMVLWISAQDEKILIATSRYFQSPFNSPINQTAGIMPFDTNKPSKSQGTETGAGESATTARNVDLQFLNSLAKDFYRLLNLDSDLADKPIDVQVTSDGLRITLFDRVRQPLFVGDTAEFTEWGRFIMQSLAWTIDRHKFRVVIEGHTRTGQKFAREDVYDGWELTADRANAARRSLVHYAVDSSLIDRVTGYADTRPVSAKTPEAEENQRVTLSLTVGRRAKNLPALANVAPAP